MAIKDSELTRVTSVAGSGLIAVTLDPDGTPLTRGILIDSFLAGRTLVAIASFGIRSSGAAFDLRIASSEVLTANRTLTITLNDAARSLTVAGNAAISGTNTGDQSSVSGNAGTATALQTARTINGTSFDGTANITVTVPISTGVSGLGTGVATFLATPSTANLAAAVTGETGTGALMFGTSPDITTGFTIGTAAASGAIVRGDGTKFAASSFTLAVPGTSGNVLTSDGTNWTSATPASGGATRALDNLASVAINSTLLPGTDASIDLGSASGPLKRWSHIYLSAFVGIVSAGGNVNEIFYSDGIGPKFWDETVSHHMVFNVQSITNDRTYTWPNSSGSVVTAPTAGPVTIAGPSAPRTVTFPNAAFTAARTDAAQSFTGTHTFDSVSTPSIITASGDLTITPGSSGNILSTRPIILQVGGQCFLAGGTDPNTYKIGITDSGGGVLRGSSTALIAFSNDSANANGTLVSGISQISNGLLAIGNGSQGDFSGGFKLTGITMGAAGTLSISSGTNQRAGNATLVGGTATVSNTTTTSNTVVILTRKTSGGTIGMAVTYTVNAGVSFTINSDSALDTSVYSYLLIEVP